MSYEKMTTERWIKNLLGDKFETASSAKKSIAKTGWPDRTKDRARACAERHFEKPGSVKMSDLVRKNGNGKSEDDVEEHASDPLRKEPEATRVKTQDMTAVRLMGAQHVVRSCREALETLQAAHNLYPEADVSFGMTLVENVLPGVLTDLMTEIKGASSPKNGKPVAKPEAAPAKVEAAPVPSPRVPPIIPHYTEEQKALFDKTAPKSPFQPGR